MTRGDVARRYHQLTAYKSVAEWRAPAEAPLVLENLEVLVLETFPAPCKEYPAGLKRVELPRIWQAGVGSQGTLDLHQLTRLCHLSAGVVRTAERANGRFYRFRASGSAGGALPARALPAATFVVTGIPWRTGWQYAERGFRHLYWDAGGMLANFIAVADDAGLEPRLRSVFPDDAATRLVGADGVQEFPLALVMLGDREPTIHPTGQAVVGTVDASVEFPLITEAKHAGEGGSLGAPWPLPCRLAVSGELDEVILRRVSARRLDPSRSVDRALLEWSLSTSLRGCGVRHF
jgi:hypothetical protein